MGFRRKREDIKLVIFWPGLVKLRLAFNSPSRQLRMMRLPSVALERWIPRPGFIGQGGSNLGFHTY